MSNTIALSFTWRENPRNGDRAFPLLSAIEGCKTCRRIETADCTDVTIKASYVYSWDVLEKIDAVLKAHPDEEDGGKLDLDAPPLLAEQEKSMAFDAILAGADTVGKVVDATGLSFGKASVALGEWRQQNG